jgi:hypothetical protein
LITKHLKINIYRTTIFPVVLYECETWSVTLRQEHRLRVLQNTVLRKIFGPKRDEVLREWRRLNNKEIYDLYSLPNIIWVMKARMRWVGYVAIWGTEVHTGFWWGNLRRKDYMENLGTDERKILKWIFKKWEWGMAWIDPSRDRDRWQALVYVVMKLQVP